MIRLLWHAMGGLIVCGLTLPPRLAGAAIAIDHRPIGCMVAGKFPRLEARFDPADQVSRARIDFHAEGDTRWYFVEMRPEAGGYRGILPQPLKSTKTIHYYIEAVDRSLAESRTDEYAPVVAGPGECSKKGLLTATPVAQALVKVGSASGGGMPAGFAAAGGISVTTVALGVAGAGAAVGGVVAVAGGGGASAPPPSTSTACVAGPPGGPTNYVLSGSTVSSTGLMDIDDYVNLYIDGRLFFRADHPPGAPCCDVSPVGFAATSGAQLTVEAGNIGGPYGIGALVVWKNGQCWQRLDTSAAPRCTMPFNLNGPNCPTGIYFRADYMLP